MSNDRRMVLSARGMLAANNQTISEQYHRAGQRAVGLPAKFAAAKPSTTVVAGRDKGFVLRGFVDYRELAREVR